MVQVTVEQKAQVSRPADDIIKDRLHGGLYIVGAAGLEPATNWLRANCSTS